MEKDTFWVIVSRIPRVFNADQLPGGAGFFLIDAAPPRVSHLILPRRISPTPSTRDDFPFVLATTSSGLLLLHATEVRRPHVVNVPGRGPLSLPASRRAYFVFDSVSATSFRIPDAPRRIPHIDNLGLCLIASPRGGRHYMVADINHITGSDRAILYYFSSETLQWNEKILRYPRPHRQWCSDVVVSHDGKLWWADLSWGLLACDPFADMPVLDFVPLPEGSLMPYLHRGRDLHKYRSIGESDGELRYVEMRANGSGIPVVRMWTLVDPKACSASAWCVEYEGCAVWSMKGALPTFGHRRATGGPGCRRRPLWSRSSTPRTRPSSTSS